MCYFVSFTASERKSLDLYRALIEGRNRANFVVTQPKSSDLTQMRYMTSGPKHQKIIDLEKN